MLYGDALQEVVTALDNAGIPATTEPTEMALPGALVVPGTMSFDILNGEDFSATINVYLLTQLNGSYMHSLNDLQDLLTKFRTVFDVPEAEPVSVPLANVGGPDPVPGLLVTLQATITKD